MLFDGIRLSEGSNLQNAAIDTGAAFPLNADVGELFYLTVDPVGLHIYDGTSWNIVGSGTVPFDSLHVKQAVRAATTGNINLSDTQTIDGVALIVGDRVLVKNQNTGSQNGIWVVQSGGWVRATDFDGSPETEVQAGDFCFVTEGTVNGDTGWILTNNGTVVIGTTALVFAQFTGATAVASGAAGYVQLSDGSGGFTTDVLSLASGIATSGGNFTITTTTTPAGVKGYTIAVTGGTGGAATIGGEGGNITIQAGTGGTSSPTFNAPSGGTLTLKGGQAGVSGGQYGGLGADVLVYGGQGGANTSPAGSFRQSGAIRLYTMADYASTYTERLAINHAGVISVNGAPGDPGQVLTSNGASVAPSWQTPAGSASTALNGTGTYSASPQNALGVYAGVSGGLPRIYFTNTNATAGQRNSQIYSTTTSGSLIWTLVNDANSAETAWLTVTRSANNASSITLTSSGGSVNLAAPTLTLSTTNVAAVIATPNASSSLGSALTIQPGTSSSGSPGALTLQGGSSSVATAGAVIVQGGTNTASNGGGAVTVRGGTGGSSTTAGSVTISGGTGAAAGGDIIFSTATTTSLAERLHIYNNGAMYFGGTAPTSGYVLTGTGNSSAPTWQALPTANLATNIAGGAAQQIPFQSGVGTTTFSASLKFDNNAQRLHLGTQSSGIVTIYGDNHMDIRNANAQWTFAAGPGPIITSNDATTTAADFHGGDNLAGRRASPAVFRGGDATIGSLSEAGNATLRGGNNEGPLAAGSVYIAGGNNAGAGADGTIYLQTAGEDRLRILPSGNINFIGTGVGRRLYADFSSAGGTRAYFQSAVAAGFSNVGVLPGAGGTGASVSLWGGDNPEASSFAQLGHSTALGYSYLDSGSSTGGTVRPMVFRIAPSAGTAPAEVARITTTGAWSFGASGTATGTFGQVLTSSGSGGAPTWTQVSGTLGSVDFGSRYTETRTSLSGTASTTIDCSLSNVFAISMAANITTLSFTNVPASGRVMNLTLFITQDATGSRIITWPASVKFAGGTAPTLTTAGLKTDIITLVTHDGGTTWYGLVAGLSF